MSEQELYEIAHRRIQQRNRRWILWSINLGVLILTLAGLILTGSTLAAAVFMGWVALFVTHTIIIGFIESSAGSIENEVAKLRTAFGDAYEKPKRLELGEDGELTEVDDRETQHAQRSRHSTRG